MGAAGENAAKPAAADPPKPHPLMTLLAGYLTSSTVRLIVHPIDTIKARMQVIKGRVVFGQRASATFRSLFRETFKTDGIRGLYRGFGVTLLVGGPATALYFHVYDKSKRFLSEKTGLKNSFLLGFLSGIMAEVVSCVLWVPIDVLKERMQVMSLLKTYEYRNTFDAIKQISNKEGLRSLYRAYGATILSFGPFTGISMATYDKLKYWLVPDVTKQSYTQSFLLSAISGMAASIATQPIDVVKVRMQVQRAENSKLHMEAGRFGYRNTFHGLSKLVHEEGLLALYKGLSARMTFGVLFSALYLSINDWVKYQVLGTTNKH